MKESYLTRQHLKAVIIVPIILALLLMSFYSCSKSSIENAVDKLTEEQIEDILDEETIGSITAKVNGVNFATSNVKEFLIASVSISEEFYIITIVGVDAQSGTKNAKVMGLYMLGQDFNNVDTGKTYDTVLEDLFVDGALAAYHENIDSDDDDSDDSFFGPNEIEEIFIKITALDREKKIISGEFNFKGTNEETGVFYEVTNGKFTDIAYEFHEN